MKSLKTLVGLLILMVNTTWAQTVELPDTNLRNKLIADYPEVMQQDELDITEAAALTGSLILQNADIRNATGVEYFTGIYTLDLSNNQLTSIPDISEISGLENLFIGYNQITGLPDLSALTQLKDVQVMENQLTELPDLSGASGLTHLYFNGNLITELPDLTLFPNLTILISGNNPIQEHVDYSVCKNLTQLHMHQTGADTIIGLEKLDQLSILYAWGNQIMDFSAIDSLTALITCVISDNPVSEIPYLANKPNLAYLDMSNCMLTFEDILPVINDDPSFSFTYKPQRTVSIKDKKFRAQRQETLKYPVENPSISNLYVWYKDGRKIDSSASAQLPFKPVEFSDSGTYRLKIYNTELTDLTLATNAFYVSVIPCMEFQLPFADVIEKDCSKGYSIDLSNANIKGGTRPYSYTLTSNVFNETFEETYIENLPAGKYEIILEDAKNCSSKDGFTLNRIERCDPVLTPNGDGVADSFFIEYPGTIKIYDTNRKLLNTLQGPTNWDGSDKNGVLIDAGYYIIIVEESNTPIYITVIR